MIQSSDNSMTQFDRSQLPVPHKAFMYKGLAKALHYIRWDTIFVELLELEIDRSPRLSRWINHSD